MKKKIIILIIICVLLITGFIGYIVWNNRIVTTIYLDINPSVNINLDKNNKVKSIKALNDDAIQYSNLATLNPKTKPITIFGYNYGDGTTRLPASMKLYEFKITQGDDVIRNYIPCFRKSDGVVGLYESITGVFYTNANSSGSDFNVNEKGYIPSEYQEVEYVETDGTQYIDVDYNIKAEERFEAKVYTETENTEMAIIGPTRGYSTLEIGFSRVGRLMNWSSNSNVITITPTTTFYNKVITFTASISDNSPYRTLTTDADGGLSSSGGTGAIQGSSIPMRLFNMQSNYPFIGKVYYLKIYDNDTLVRNFKPCYRKRDGVAGLYDIENGVFYPNSNQEGNNFGVGSDVTDYITSISSSESEDITLSANWKPDTVAFKVSVSASDIGLTQSEFENEVSGLDGVLDGGKFTFNDVVMINYRSLIIDTNGIVLTNYDLNTHVPLSIKINNNTLNPDGEDINVSSSTVTQEIMEYYLSNSSTPIELAITSID